MGGAIIVCTFCLFALTMRIKFQSSKREKNEQLESKEEYKKNIKKVFGSSVYWNFFFISVLLTIHPNLVQMSYRVLCDAHAINLEIIKTNYTISGVCGACLCLFAGWLNDKYGLRGILISIGFAFSLSSVCYILTLKYSSGILFCVMIYLNNIFLAVTNSMIFPNLIKIFGIKYVTEMYGQLMIALTVVSFLMSTALTFFTKTFGTNYDLPYFIMIGSAGLLAFVSMFISMALPTEKFDYSDETDKNIDENITSALIE